MLNAMQAQMSEVQNELQKERSESQYKIGFLLRQKQEMEARIFQQQDAMKKYSQTLEQMQRESQAEKTQMMTTSSSALQQSKIREEDLQAQLEQSNFKANQLEQSLRSQGEELTAVKTENENLQIDLKSLVNIEQALRQELNQSFQKMAAMDDYIQKINSKMMEDQQKLNDALNENENMKQDLLQFHKTIEMGSRENESLKQEVQMLRDELLKKHQDNNQNATSLADKDNEIFSLKAELARTKALLSTQAPKDQYEKYSNSKSSNLDMLLKQNSDSFASDYLNSMRGQHKEQDMPQNQFSKPAYNSFDETPIGGAQQNKTQSTYDKFGYKPPAMNQFQRPTQEYQGLKSALPEPGPEKPKKGPKTTQGLPPNSQYKQQEWSPYLP
jgi:chromosome segregation ATPase